MDVPPPHEASPRFPGQSGTPRSACDSRSRSCASFSPRSLTGGQVFLTALHARVVPGPRTDGAGNLVALRRLAQIFVCERLPRLPGRAFVRCRRINKTRAAAYLAWRKAHLSRLLRESFDRVSRRLLF